MRLKDPRVLNLGTRRKWVVGQFQTTRHFTNGEEIPDINLIKLGDGL